jgi:hypothetical protein
MIAASRELSPADVERTEGARSRWSRRKGGVLGLLGRKPAGPVQ